MITLHNEDCIDLINRNIDSKVHHIITDPPYLINYKKWDSDKYRLEILHRFELMTKHLGKNSNLILFTGWSSACTVIRFLEGIGFGLKNWIIWDRVKCKNPGNNLTSTREDALWFVRKDNDSLCFNKMDSKIKKKTKGYGIKNGSEYRRISNVWTDIGPVSYMSKEYEGNDCQKPVELMERCVKLWTNKHDIVFDPFMGSGATGQACLNLDRHFIGCEIDKEVYNKARRRLTIE